MRYLTMKKFLLTVCILALTLVALTGCGQAEPVPQPTEAPEVTETAPVPTESQASTLDPDVYAVCTALPRETVEQFAQQIRELILAENWAELSGSIAYPVVIGSSTCQDTASFLEAVAEESPDADAMAALREEDCTDLFCNYTGIMMGNGEVWFSEVLNGDLSSAGLRITALQLWSRN